MGGFAPSTQQQLMDDVWFSQDGILWSPATLVAEWLPRQSHASVMMNDALWVLGGDAGPVLNDVWYSLDGVQWDVATFSANWGARYCHKSAVLAHEIWVAAGSEDNGNLLHDSWSSFNPELQLPEFSPPPSNYEGSLQVSIIGPQGAVVFVTTDGSDPTSESPVYTRPLTLGVGNATLKAAARLLGMRPSGISSAFYSITPADGSWALWRTLAVALGIFTSVALIIMVAVVVRLLQIRRRQGGMMATSLLMPRMASDLAGRMGSPTRMSSCYEVWHVDPKDVELMHVVGVGSYCKVWRGKWKGMEVAVKEHLLAGSSFLMDEDVKTFVCEAEMLSTLRHPHVLQFWGAAITGREMLILTEFCALGSLRQVLGDKRICLGFDRALLIAKQVAAGMNYLHTRAQPVVHRDLKSPNVLLTDQWVAKVADFGVARIVDERGIMTQGLGSALWGAPEVLQRNKYSVAADVYAFGIVMWECVTRHEPYEGLSATQVALAVVDGQRPDLSLVPTTVAPAFVELIKDCWTDLPAARPNFHAVVERLEAIQP